MRVRLLPVVVAACVAGWAGPLVLHESFRPIAARHTLTAAEPSAAVSVPVRQPMVLEYELVVHAAEGRRPAVTARWNDRAVLLPPSPPFATSRALVVLRRSRPPPPARTGSVWPSTTLGGRLRDARPAAQLPRHRPRSAARLHRAAGGAA
ncbi:MAG: hypothetical protein R2708_10700 [Vicinamibacterales bacterium]